MIMNSLTAFRHLITHRIKQLYSNHILTPCLLCGTDTEQACLCTKCFNDLPILGHHCQRCAMPIAHGQYCGQCLIKPPIRHHTKSLFRYTSPLDELIGDMKYHDQLHLINYFGIQLSAYLQQQNTPKPTLLIPIPLHPKKLRLRGYNQSTELAKTLSKQLNIPLDSNNLIRTKNTLPQTQLPYNKRKQNMNSAFQYRHKGLPKHIALIDDVLTTGHTADMAAKVCLKHGAKTVEVWTIARTIREYA